MNIRNLMQRTFAVGIFTLAVLTILTTLAAASSAQDDMNVINRSQVPATAKTLGAFVPKGWIIEQQIIGNVGGDGDTFIALKLIEDKPLTETRNRAMVIALKDDKGDLKNAGVAGKLLQCPGCGGAFYGIMDAPADVKVGDKGVITITQDGGSRWVWTETYKFRFDTASGKFQLIGFDYAVRDRNTGQVDSESTNYITGDRVTTHGKGKADKTTKTQVKVAKTYLDDADHEKFADDAGKRLGVN